MQKPASAVQARLSEKKTPWPSIFTTSAMMCLTGLQKSIYLSSSWPFIVSLYPHVSMNLFGWAMAATPLGCAIANPLFGYWNQKTGSTVKPLTAGYVLCVLANLLYAMLPSVSEALFPTALFASRLLMGLGCATLVNLRSFIATASTSDDRVKAVSVGTAGYTAGFSIGPGLQILFIPIGLARYSLGPVVLNMYTTAAWFMVLVNLIALVLANLLLKEEYSGIVTDEEKKDDPFLVIPQSDRSAVFLLFFVWCVYSGFASTEVLASTVTMTMYNWSSEEAVLYNGILQTINCVANTATYILIGSTKFGKLDSRIHLALGFLAFLVFYGIHLPLPFYEGPLDRIPLQNGTMVAGAGGCSWDYSWCDDTPRVPKYLYLFAFSVLLGIGFPLVSHPCFTILSQVLGPRKQGLIQGLFALTGNIYQFIMPVSSSIMFEATGYGYIMGWHVLMISICLLLILFFRKRLVKLELTPPLGQGTKYKLGTFYRL